jgi:4-amino-4-deoxy-L-arabinose transferase-like glycosyltransferase
VVLVAWAIRLPPALETTLHPDEALYAFWGRLVASGRDPLLTGVPVYKPPLLPYVAAGAQLAFGDPDTTLRFPGLAAGLLAIVLTAALARSLFGDKWLAGPSALVVALSPFAALFSATLFPDPLMTALGVGACAAAARRRPLSAGLLAALAFAAKQTGLVWAPLVLGLLLVRGRGQLRPLLRFCAGFIALLGLVFAWDLVRSLEGAQSFWDVGVSGYGGLRIIWPHELVPRLSDWARLAGYLSASRPLNALLVLGIPLLVWSALGRGRLTTAGISDILLAGFVVAALLVHWLLAFPVWDRYLLPLVPVLALLAARIAREVCRATWELAERWRAREEKGREIRCHPRRGAIQQAVAQVVLVAMLAGPAANALAGNLPVGGDHGASQGINQVAGYLADLPAGSVVYHHWQGWHLRYYLFDAPVFLAYWPDPAWLVQDVRTFGSGGMRLVTFPAQESADRVSRDLRAVGYGLEPVLTTRSSDGRITFSLYRIVLLGEAAES